ncbi:uncharacterized protein Eint_051235 [Encephalitozoon intestinalis ATCC 50506]|uniref:Uncharacterized protein n=1 Tax=Encephalitozoon intestinalis (strain ATCC 50506) TaxID=876142 RepID=W8PKG5_ENCIT|nr:uncharacterized protein Eint_051235 [Encephalitozoon intestinalis ATCC 50506]AHL30105.1 hypothetical protein Eint_051235 [Encephalitozoon intestinalis ATCC 50506]UTX45287.1 hypothetical protein GPK93_05g08330 [Encephalitozoon intestinalis]
MNNRKKFEEIKQQLESFLTPKHLRNEFPQEKGWMMPENSPYKNEYRKEG